MENNSFQTSFIPKKPINATISGSSVGFEKKHSNPFVTFSVIIFILTILISGGLFFYKSYLINQKDNLASTLGQIKNSFEQGTISELELFDKRMSASKQALSNHIVLSPMFSLLGEVTIPVVQFTEFNHESTDEGFIVKISGISPDYRSIALQADMFNSSKGRMFKNVIFSNLNKDKNNKVTFDVEFLVDPSLLSYENSILTEAQ